MTNTRSNVTPATLFVLLLLSLIPNVESSVIFDSGAEKVDRSCNDGESSPLRIFLFSGQSNMVGHASLQHLKLLINGTDIYKDEFKEEYQTLWDGHGFRKRDDVFIQYGSSRGPLSADGGFAAPNQFGPELGFGWSVGDALASPNDPIVLIKSAVGGRTLGIDYRPPSSGEGNYSGVKPSHYGWEYRQMITDFTNALANLKDIYPGYNETEGYSIEGFVWFQGWNDMLNWNTVLEYGFNLKNFIRDVRLDLDTPNMPFVIGELGMAGLHPTGRGSDRVLKIRQEMREVTLDPNFYDSSIYVTTAEYVRPNGTSYNGGYHYFGRADTYYHIGKAFGRGMLEILGQRRMGQVVKRNFCSPNLDPNPLRRGEYAQSEKDSLSQS